jgi:hypothetical protein
MKVLKGQAGGLQRIHLRDCLIRAKDAGGKIRCTGILRTINREESKSIWRQIAINDPSLGAVPFVQRMEQGEVIDIYDAEEMNQEIQVTMEKRFDLSMSAPITMTSLRERLGFSLDTDFAMSMLWGEVHIPANVDNASTIVIEEIIRLFQALHKGHAKVSLGADEFRYYWRRVREKTSLAISTVHFGHYKSATYSDRVTEFLATKITLIARGGCTPKRWGHGLQVLLEKNAGVALATKLRAILLMEGNFNYMNKWIFGHKAINKLYALGFVPGDQYSQKESTV